MVENYAKVPKRKVISARTKEYRFATYMEAWRQKIERFGTLNYPQDAKGNPLHGTLRMAVDISPDGRIKSIKILKSSGKRRLDAAAEQIVRMASPFARFPQNIRKDTDVIQIIRTWQFNSRGGLATR